MLLRSLMDPFTNCYWFPFICVELLSIWRILVSWGTHESGNKSRLSFSGGPHSPVNMADSIWKVEVNVGRKKTPQEMVRLLRCTALYFVRQVSQIFEVLRDFHRLFGSRNSPTTGILHTIRHVYRSVWPAREARPRFGAVLERSAHDCETYWCACRCQTSKQITPGKIDY